MSSPIVSNVPSLGSTRTVRQVRGDEQAVLPNEQAAQEATAETTGVQVSFSEALRERLGGMRKSVGALSQQAANTRKQQARERIEQIRQRIKVLKMMVASLGGMAPKALLREIEQLARALGQAAAVLKEGGGTAPGSAGAISVAGGTSEETAGTDSLAADAGVESLAEVAAVAVSEPVPDERADAEGTADAGSGAPAAASETPRAGHDVALAFRAGDADRAQRRADAEQIRKAVSELKALLALVRASQSADDESDRQVRRIEKSLRDCESAAVALGGLGGVSISV